MASNPADDTGPPGALDGLQVLDLTTAMGQPSGRALADLGADVVLVEPPDGSPSRQMAPFAGGEPHAEKGIYFLSFNTNKRSLVLDLESASGPGALPPPPPCAPTSSSNASRLIIWTR